MSAKITAESIAKKNLPVYLFYGSEHFLLKKKCGELRDALLAGETEFTEFDDAAPEIEGLIAEAGTISFFGTKRLIYLSNLQIQKYDEENYGEFFDLLNSMENAVFLLCAPLEKPDGKSSGITKKLQKLITLCAKIGYAEKCEQPSRREIRDELTEHAAACNTKLSPANAELLMDRCGEDMALLLCELEKLCAASGYTEVTRPLIEEFSTANIEAKAYDLTKQMIAGNAANACSKLHDLLQMRTDEFMLAGALASCYCELYRARLAARGRVDTLTFAKDFSAKGNPSRLQYVYKDAARYTEKQLTQCLDILFELDSSMKSLPIDPDILLETAVCRICTVR